MDALAAYRDNSISTQSPGNLIVMLYDGAVNFLEQAIVALNEKDHQRKADCINRAAAIIEELNVNLDIEVGGEVALSLRRLYVFMLRHLNQAVPKSDPNMIRNVIRLLKDLNESWRAISN